MSSHGILSSVAKEPTHPLPPIHARTRSSSPAHSCQALWEDTLSALSTPEDASNGAEAQVLSHLLAPGQMCRSSLRDALAYHGTQISVSEVESVPLKHLVGCIRGAVQMLHRRQEPWP